MTLTAHGTPPMIATDAFIITAIQIVARVRYVVQIHTDDTR